MAGIAPRHQREDFPPHPDDPFLAVRSFVLYQITMEGARGQIRFLRFLEFGGERDFAHIRENIVRTKFQVISTNANAPKANNPG